MAESMKKNPIFESEDWKALAQFLNSKPELKSFAKNLENIEATVNKYLAIISDMKQELVAATNNIKQLQDNQVEMLSLIKMERKKRILTECEMISNTIIIYGQKVHKKAEEGKRNETSKETKEQVT